HGDSNSPAWGVSPNPQKGIFQGQASVSGWRYALSASRDVPTGNGGIPMMALSFAIRDMVGAYSVMQNRRLLLTSRGADAQNGSRSLGPSQVRCPWSVGPRHHDDL